MFVHVLFMFPETAGKTLEETQLMFEDPNGIRHIGTPAWKTRGAYGNVVRLEQGEIEPDRKASLFHNEDVSAHKNGVEQKV